MISKVADNQWPHVSAMLVTFAMMTVVTGCTDKAAPQVDSTSAAANRESPGAVAAVQSDTDKQSLPEQQQQRIWDIEHLAFMVEVEVFPVWKKALASRSTDSLQRFFADNAAATIPLPDSQQTLQHGSVTVSQLSGEQDAGAAEFLTALTSLMDRVDDSMPSRVSLGLVRLSPQDESPALDGAWKSVWKLQIAGAKEGRPVDINARMSFDFSSVTEGMDQRDAWIQTASLHDVREVSATHPLMEEVTDKSGIAVDRMRDNWRPECDGDFKTKTGGAYVCDYNLDGIPDVLIEDLEAGRVLYRGRGDGTFEDCTEQAGLALPPDQSKLLWTAAIWADLDGDGDEDLVSEGSLFENLGNGTFADVTAKTNLRLTPAAGYAIADYDLDGRVDLYVCHTSKYLPGQTVTTAVPWIDGTLGIDNVLWRNEGDWKFRDVTAETNAGGEGTVCFAAVWLDANLDGYPDVLCINEFGRNALLLNDGGKRFTSHDIDPVFGGFSMGVSAGDVNNDGRLDVYVANMYSKAGNRIISNVDPASYDGDMYDKLVDATLGSRLYLGNSDGQLVSVPHESGLSDVGWAYGPGFGDFDADGLADIYATVGFRSVKKGEPDG